MSMGFSEDSGRMVIFSIFSSIVTTFSVILQYLIFFFVSLLLHLFYALLFYAKWRT